MRPHQSSPSPGPTGGAFPQPPSTGSMQCQLGNLLIVVIATKGSPVKTRRMSPAVNPHPPNPVAWILLTRGAQDCPGKWRPLHDCRSAQPSISVIRFARAPLRPSGGRGRGPRSGRVRWAMPRTGSSTPLTLPSPPGRRGERISKRRLREISLASFRKDSARIFPGQPCASGARKKSGSFNRPDV